MHRFKVALGVLVDWLFACSHRKKSFPMTLRTSTQKVETYVVCLECARRFEYDWTTMRIIGQPATAVFASGLHARLDWRDSDSRQPAQY